MHEPSGSDSDSDSKLLASQIFMSGISVQGVEELEGQVQELLWRDAI